MFRCRAISRGTTDSTGKDPLYHTHPFPGGPPDAKVAGAGAVTFWRILTQPGGSDAFSLLRVCPVHASTTGIHKATYEVGPYGLGGAVS